MKYIIYSLFFIILISCDSRIKFKKPKDLITKEEMIDLLTDMHLANGTSGISNIHEEKNKNYMALVYEKYGIDSVRFAESNLYYASNVDEYEKIFVAVEKRLLVLKKKYQTELDSILDEADENMKKGSTPQERINRINRIDNN